MDKKFHFISGAFSRKMIRLRCSWSWVLDSFASDLEKLFQSDLLQEEGPSERIWTTKQKFVLKVHTPEGRVVAYKTYRRIKRPRAYMFRASPTGMEALNYAMLEEMSLPMAKLLSVGETRKFFWTRTAYLITEFVPGSRNGLAFLPDREFGAHKAYLQEFCRKNLACLALLHDHGVIHNGTAPYNMLWKEKSPSEQKPDDALDVIWIDVASCRKRSFGRRFVKGVRNDLAKFLTPYGFSREEMLAFIRHYCDHVHYTEKESLFAELTRDLS